MHNHVRMPIDVTGRVSVQSVIEGRRKQQLGKSLANFGRGTLGAHGAWRSQATSGCQLSATRVPKHKFASAVLSQPRKVG